jgi:hypothetical protein
MDDGGLRPRNTPIKSIGENKRQPRCRCHPGSHVRAIHFGKNRPHHRRDHQKITVERYARLIDLTNGYVMPVLQGYSPESYAAHLALFGELLIPGQ